MLYKILIVEDEPVIASSEREFLEAAFEDYNDINLHIDIADRKEYALELIKYAIEKKKPYDLIIADLNLKDESDARTRDTSGYKLIKQLAKIPNSPKIIIRSAYPSARISKELSLNELLSLGCVDHIETRANIPKSGWLIRDRIELTGAVKDLIMSKRESLTTHRELKYDRLLYSYDKKKWFCDGKEMDKLVYPYDKLLLLFITNQGNVLRAERIFEYLNGLRANYVTKSKETLSNKVSYRVKRLRDILNAYGYSENEIIITSPRGGYMAKYLS